MKLFSKFLALFIAIIMMTGLLYAVDPLPHPNPWRCGENNSANGGIDFNVRTDAVKADLRIYDLNGDQVRHIEVTDAGLLATGTVTWNGHNDNGWMVAGGVYFYALEVEFPSGTGTEDETYKGRIIVIN